MIKILFVCTANICRSPTAHAILQKRINNARLQNHIEVDSAGTHGTEGVPADPRSAMIAARKGVNLSGLYSRALTDSDFSEFDHILIMDQKNLSAIQRKWPNIDHSQVKLLMEYSERSEQEVPDPYKGEAEDFINAYLLIDNACAGLINHLQQQINSN